ncbi:YecA family protein [Bacillus gobiensis]|uniref:YecA family protein n=1 Tax=Bacillus gobiensis TaxID=1441095 RepID=UPI003D22864B
MKVKRNAPCPCGSGKKYKKCCGNKVLEFPGIIAVKEANELQAELHRFAYANYKKEITRFFEEDGFKDTIPSTDEREGYYHILSIWYFFFGNTKRRNTIFEEFLQRKESQITRKRTYEIMESWRNISPTLLLVKEINQTVVSFEDVIQKDEIRIDLAEYSNSVPEKGSLVAGCLVPMGNQFDFFLQFIEFPKEKTEELVSKVYSDLKAYLDSEGHADKYLKEKFSKVLKILFSKEEETLKPLSIEWRNDKEFQTAELIKSKLKEDNIAKQLIPEALALWEMYCLNAEPTIRKPESYAAALEYFLYLLPNSPGPVSKAFIAKKYGVSAQTVTRRLGDLEEVFEKAVI